MSHTGNQVDGKTFAIGVLSVTACVLFVGLMLVSTPAAAPTAAYAIGQNDRGGDYIMLTQQVSNTNEAVVVIDAAARWMIVYLFDYNDKTLEILERVPLSQLPKPQEPNADQRPRRGRR